MSARYVDLDRKTLDSIFRDNFCDKIETTESDMNNLELPRQGAGPQWLARVALMMTGIRIAKNGKAIGEINNDGTRKAHLRDS
jgi:hypothetical protein